MRVKVILSKYETTSGDQAQVWVECGSGEQILRWLAYTSCARLAYLRGDAPQMYVPQAVNANDGTVLDVDLVLNEVLGDGDSLSVEYGRGPEAFKIRWDGRPTTPPFKWGEEGIIGPSDHEWLEEMDMKAFGIDRLVDEAMVTANPASLDQDLNATKEVLRQYAGGLQALYKFYEAMKDEDELMLDKMSMEAYRALLVDARLPTDHFKINHIDECFVKCMEVISARSEGKGRRDQTGSTWLSLQEFFVVICWVAHSRFVQKETLSTDPSLSAKVFTLISAFLFPNLGSAITERLRSLEGSFTPYTATLLKKGRRLTEQTLDSCQLRRVPGSERRLDVKYLCGHLRKWGILSTKGISMSTLMTILLFSKHQEFDLTKMELKRHPMEVNYDEFERLLHALAYKMYHLEENREETFEEFLGETLDDIYKKSGVLVEIKKH